MSVKNRIVIHVEDLTFERNGEDIIHDFSFDVRAGDYVGVIGPNGGGKTTLLRLLLGLMRPTHGAIEILGGAPTDRRVREQLGYVAQRGGNLDAQFPATVEEVIRSGALNERVMKRVVKEMNVQHLMKRPMSRLSGGERQKVLLTRAIAREPKILFLDEPVDGLDPTSRDAFYALLRKLNQSGLTIIFVTHDVHTVAEEARSAICLKHQLVCHGHKACVIGQEKLRDLFHPDREEILAHHDT